MWCSVNTFGALGRPLPKYDAPIFCTDHRLSHTLSPLIILPENYVWTVDPTKREHTDAHGLFTTTALLHKTANSYRYPTGL